MTDDGLMVLVNGYVLDRPTVVASLNDAPAWHDYQILEPRLVNLCSDAAALIYRAVARRGEAAPFEALLTIVYRLIDGQPRLALYTQTTDALALHGVRSGS